MDLKRDQHLRFKLHRSSSRYQRCAAVVSRQMEMTRGELFQKYRIHVFVAAILLTIVISVSLSWHYRYRNMRMLMSTQTIFFDPRSRLLTLTDPAMVSSVTLALGLDLPRWQLPLHCPVVMEDDPSAKDCLWKERALLSLKHFGEDTVQCYSVTWESFTHRHVPHDCVELGPALWYGPSNQSEVTFPMRGSFTFQPDIHSTGGNGVFGSAVDFYWLSSSGAAIFVPGDNPIHVNFNTTGDNRLCVSSNYTGPLYSLDKENTPPEMSYTLCQGRDPVSTHMFMQHLFPELKTPSREVLHDAHWSMEGVAGENFTQQDVEDLVARLKGATFGDTQGDQLRNGSITLDGNWQKHNGDLIPDAQRFTNLTSLRTAVEEAGLHLSLSVSPHFQYLSRNFHEGEGASLFVKDAGGHVTGLTNADAGTAAALDVFSGASQAWFKAKLKALRDDLGVSAFRLTYGKGAWLPYKPHFSRPEGTPDAYRKLLTEFLSEQSEAVTVEHTSSSRHVPSLLPVHTTTRVVDNKQCLSDVIGTALTLGIMGYPFVMADGISGSRGADPSRELYIRWLQLTTFFPVRQFSVPPWKYGAGVEAIAANLSALRHTHVTPVLQSDVTMANIREGVALLRPVWWSDPGNATVHSLEISDQFLLGGDLLVAPVVCEGVRGRDVYIPPGIWEDVRDGSFLMGPRTLTNYPAGVKEVALFLRRTVRGHGEM